MAGRVTRRMTGTIVMALVLVAACGPSASSTQTPSSPTPTTSPTAIPGATSAHTFEATPSPSAGATSGPTQGPTPGSTTAPTPGSTFRPNPGLPGTLVVVGRIVTMADPPVVEAILIEDGAVTALGTRDQILAKAGDDVPVIELGENVAYPGFIDSHAHWIGDRGMYGASSPAEAMRDAIVRGWTSISEQWVDQGRLSELEGLAATDSLPLRVDGYIALNGLNVADYYGDWYADRDPGPIGDRLMVQGVKIHLDSGSGATIFWDSSHLNAAIRNADNAGWQVSVHAVTTEAIEMALNSFEAAIGPSGPNPLHHRIEHALQVTDDQLARMVAMDLVPVIQLESAPVDWVTWAATQGNDMTAEDLHSLARWKDFEDAGLHVAASSDAPWFFPASGIADDHGRPVDQIAGGMDGRGTAYPTPDWMLDQLLTAQQGLSGVTVEAAYALQDESRRGHLAVGTLGDVTILSRDLLNATPDEIRAFDVIATIVGGNIAYCSVAQVCGSD